MIISILSLLILIGSMVLILSNIRGVARDTINAVSSVAANLVDRRDLTSNIALIALWCLIFWLSYV